MSGLYHSKYKKFTPDQSLFPNISLFSPNNQLSQQAFVGQNLNLLSERLVSLQVNKLMGNSGGNGSTDNPEDECPPGTICLDDVTITAPTPQPPNDDPGVDIPDLPPAGPVDYFPTEPTIPTGTETGSEPPTTAVNPCNEAKALTKALNEALEKQEVKGMLTALKETKNSNVEHGFLITKDANGYHATAIVTGGTNSVGFTYDTNTNVVFVVHVHPPNTSAAPSSTDILGLGNYGAGFEGNIILQDDDMYMVSVTDQTAYDKFKQKSTEKNYYDKDSPNGWKDKSNVDDDFRSFSRDYTEIYKGVDATYPTQLYLMNRYKMGTTVQKWNASENKFQPQELNVETNNSTGSSSTIGGGGNVINSRYKKIEVDKKDCPN